jgi:flagellin-specific chaperone FliS
MPLIKQLFLLENILYIYRWQQTSLRKLNCKNIKNILDTFIPNYRKFSSVFKQILLLLEKPSF